MHPVLLAATSCVDCKIIYTNHTKSGGPSRALKNDSLLRSWLGDGFCSLKTKDLEITFVENKTC